MDRSVPLQALIAPQPLHHILLSQPANGDKPSAPSLGWRPNRSVKFPLPPACSALSHKNLTMLNSLIQGSVKHQGRRT